MTINHKVDIKNIKKEAKETYDSRKAKIKFGVSCLVLGAIIGFSKGLTAGSNRVIILTNDHK